MITLDQQVFLWLNDLLSERIFSILFYAVTWLGNGIVLAALIVPAMAWKDRVSLRHHLLPMVVAVAITGAIVNLAKIVMGRARPPHWAASLGIDIHAPIAVPPDRSFPSGHAQTAFGAAVYLSCLYPRGAPVFLILATLVGLSRIALGVHFPGDVIVGATVGALGSLVGYRWASRRQRLRP